MTPKLGQVGHDEAERVTQDLMAAYAVECSELAMYESLATAAAAAHPPYPGTRRAANDLDTSLDSDDELARHR
ncbi:MAG: hypothetical protein C4321_08690 [Chloroflexota bacterium]